MSTFLTQGELRQLTGKARKDLQVAWLEDRGWDYELTWSGHPVVLRAVMEKKMGLSKPASRKRGPNFEALQRKTP